MNRSPHQMEEIQEKLEDCLNVINIPARNGGPGYNDQSKKFLLSLGEKILDGGSTWVTDKQLKWLNDLYERI